MDLSGRIGLNGQSISSAGSMASMSSIAHRAFRPVRYALKTSAFDFHLSKPLDVHELERLISRFRAADKLAADN